MRKYAILLVALPLLGGVPAAAQPGAPAQGRDHSGITLTLHGLLAPGPVGELSIPRPLLERLAGEQSLVMLETTPGPNGRPRLEVRFVFADMAAFSAWYERLDTRTLLRDLQSATTSDSLQLLVSLHRAGFAAR